MHLFAELCRASAVVGRDHLVAPVNTLCSRMRRAAAAAADLLLTGGRFRRSGQPQDRRDARGSVGLVAAVPLTTATAALLPCGCRSCCRPKTTTPTTTRHGLTADRDAGLRRVCAYWRLCGGDGSRSGGAGPSHSPRAAQAMHDAATSPARAPFAARRRSRSPSVESPSRCAPGSRRAVAREPLWHAAARHRFCYRTPAWVLGADNYSTWTVIRSVTGGRSGAWSRPTSCTANECLPGATPAQV